MRGDDLEFLNEESLQYFRDLSGKITKNQVVLFVGAGLSRNARRKDGALNVKFPLWSGLTERMLTKLYGEDKEKIAREKYDYLNVADKFEAQFDRVSLIQLIEESMEEAEYEPGPIHQLISRFDWEILTTNFDTLIERGFALSNKTPNLILSDADLSIIEQPRIFKINGCIKNARDQIIITGEDFRTFSEKKPIIELYVKRCFIESSVLFVGFSLYDPAFKMIHGWVRDHLMKEKANRFAYSIQFTVDEPTKKIWASRGIRFIELFPDGFGNEELVKTRLFSLFHSLYQEQREEVEPPKSNHSARQKEKTEELIELINNLERCLEQFRDDARKFEKNSDIQCSKVQAQLADKFLECLNWLSFNEIFDKIPRDSHIKEWKKVWILGKYTYLLEKYFCKIQNENILSDLLKKIISNLDNTKGRLFENIKITGWLSKVLERFLMKGPDKLKVDNPNILIMALYIALRLGISQRLLPAEFFKEGFKVIRTKALEGDKEHKVSRDLHRYWLFSVILTGQFRCANALLKISRNIHPQRVSWDISDFIHYHLEVFFGDWMKCRDLFLRAVNTFRNPNEREAFRKFLLLDTFLTKFREKKYSDLFLDRTYKELSGRFREESHRFKSTITSVSLPLRETYLQSVVQAIFNIVDRGKSFMFTGISPAILSFPNLTVEKRDIETLKKTFLGEFFLLAVIYDKPRRGKEKEKEFKGLMTLFIDTGIIDTSAFLDLLLLRLENAEIGDMVQEEDNGISRYLAGLVAFIDCALPYLEKTDLKKIKRTIENCLLQIKLPDIRESLIRIIAYISEQLPEENFDEALRCIFSLATEESYFSLGLKHLTLTDKVLGGQKIVKFSQIRLILDRSIEKQGTQFDRDFIYFMLNHKRNQLFEENDLINATLKIHFALIIQEARYLSLQWLMDLHQFIDKGFIQLGDDMKRDIGEFVTNAFKLSGIPREWKIFSESMIPVYETFAKFLKAEMIEQIIDEFFKNDKREIVPLMEIAEKDRDNLAHLLGVVYSSSHHKELDEAILKIIKTFVKEKQAGNGHLGAFWEQLKPGEKKKLGDTMLELWQPDSEENIIKAMKATGEFLKYPTDEKVVGELSNRLLYCVFTGSAAVKTLWCKIIIMLAQIEQEQEKKEHRWYDKQKDRILSTLDYLKGEKDLEFLRTFLKLLQLFKPEEVKDIVEYLIDEDKDKDKDKRKVPYAEIRRTAKRLHPNH